MSERAPRNENDTEVDPVAGIELTESVGGARELTIRGERVRLLAEGALYWPRESLLAVADFHLGKAETFGKNGYALPGQAQWDDLARLQAVIRREGARLLVFLGDLVHARQGLDQDMEERFAAALTEVKVEAWLTAGNHDRGLVRRWPPAWKEIGVVGELLREPFTFRHEEADGHEVTRRAKQDDENFFAWTGHLHPCTRLSGGADSLRLKTFVVRRDHGILPAFSGLAGGFNVRPDARTKLYPVADGRVYEI